MMSLLHVNLRSCKLSLASAAAAFREVRLQPFLFFPYFMTFNGCSLFSIASLYHAAVSDNMRLTDVHTMELKEFNHGTLPECAILSHCWTDDEISYKGLIKGRKKDSRGYDEILRFCQAM